MTPRTFINAINENLASELFPCHICSEVFFLHENWKRQIESVHEEKQHCFLNSVSIKDENFDIPDEKLILDNFVKSCQKIDSEDMIIPEKVIQIIFPFLVEQKS